MCVDVRAPSDPEGVLQKGSWHAANPKRSGSSCFSSLQLGQLSWVDHVSCCSTCDLWTGVGVFWVWQGASPLSISLDAPPHHRSPAAKPKENRHEQFRLIQTMSIRLVHTSSQSPLRNISHIFLVYMCMSYLDLFFRFCGCGAIAFIVLCILLVASPRRLLFFLIGMNKLHF